MIMDSESCTDAIQNQDEMGIDCGGTCPESCGKTLKFLYYTGYQKSYTYYSFYINTLFIFNW